MCCGLGELARLLGSRHDLKHPSVLFFRILKKSSLWQQYAVGAAGEGGDVEPAP
jgi:hypothetical protein